MQKYLREGEQDLGFQDECVPMPACPKFRFFPVPSARKPVFHPIWRFRGWCGGTCGGRYPSRLAVLKNKKENRRGTWGYSPYSGISARRTCRRTNRGNAKSDGDRVCEPTAPGKNLNFGQAGMGTHLS